MDIVIIEDEPLTAEDLADTISKVDDRSQVVACLESIKESVDYFNNNDSPDLIFSDIQLSDGLCFELFSQLDITIPVIFCTAYNEYAIQAFKANGIDYIVKPFTGEMVSEALGRYHKLKHTLSGQPDPIPYDALMDMLTEQKDRTPESLLVNHKDQILPIKIQDVALFFIENGMTRLLTFDRDLYFIDKSLDDLDQLTDSIFFRVNRQHLINRDAVKSASQKFNRKLAVRPSIPYKESITVSKAKVPEFLDWLGQ